MKISIEFNSVFHQTRFEAQLQHLHISYSVIGNTVTVPEDTFEERPYKITITSGWAKIEFKTEEDEK